MEPRGDPMGLFRRPIHARPADEQDGDAGHDGERKWDSGGKRVRVPPRPADHTEVPER